MLYTIVYSLHIYTYIYLYYIILYNIHNIIILYTAHDLSTSELKTVTLTVIDTVTVDIPNHRRIPNRSGQWTRVALTSD